MKTQFTAFTARVCGNEGVGLLNLQLALPRYVSQTKPKRRLHDRKTEHFKALSKNCQKSAIADHITSTGHNIKWDHFEILSTGCSDIHYRIKESLLIKDLKPSLNENVGSEKLFLY